MGRRKREIQVIVVRTAITLTPGLDDDLIKVFEQVPARKRSSFIKSGLRTGSLQINIEGLPDDNDLAESLDNFLL